MALVRNRVRRRRREKLFRLMLIGEQRLHFAAELVIFATGPSKKFSALAEGTPKSLLAEALDLPPPLTLFLSLFISRISHTFAIVQLHS
jgi:hypothetical protein